jgi:hypothetical protein
MHARVPCEERMRALRAQDINSVALRLAAVAGRSYFDEHMLWIVHLK